MVWYNVWFNFLRHVIDILVVAYLFYRVMLFVRGTRSVQMRGSLAARSAYGQAVSCLVAQPA